MRGSKRITSLIIFFIIFGLAICCGVICFFLQKYFFYNKYNIYAQRAVLDRLNKRYNQEFELLSTEFETKEVGTGGAKYVHVWKFTFRDNEGKQFLAYSRLYGLVEKGDGNLHAPDYP